MYARKCMHNPTGPSATLGFPLVSRYQLNCWSQLTGTVQRLAQLCVDAQSLSTAAAAGAYLLSVEKNPNKKIQQSENLLSDTLAQSWLWQTISPTTKNRILDHLHQASRRWKLGSIHPTPRLTSTNQRYLFPHMMTLRVLLAHCPVRCAEMMMMSQSTDDSYRGQTTRFAQTYFNNKQASQTLYQIILP